MMMLTRTSKRRLLKLADLLIKDAKNRKGMTFDIQMVGQKTGQETFNWSATPVNFTPELKCGTTGCAMGLAAISGAFKRAGLGYKVPKESGFITITVDGRNKEFDVAAMKVFGLTIKEARFLFSPESYEEEGEHIKGAKGERQVAKRIKDFVAGKVKPPGNVFRW